MNFQEKNKILEDAIKKYAPIVAESFNNNQTVFEYSKKLYDYNLDNVHEIRQKNIIRDLENNILEIFGRKEILRLPLAINIVDHHAILNHPILLATNILGNAYKLLDKDNKNKSSIVVLTSAIVPPNNFFNRKGFLLNGKRVPLFSNKEMHQASCFIPLHKFSFIERLKNIKSWHDFNEKEKNFLINLEKEICKIDFSRAKDYSDQISIINEFLWKMIFADDVRGHIPDLFYITQEKYFTKIISIILSEDNIVKKSLFNSEFRDLVIKKFDGLIGCWDNRNKKGTHFFWYRNKNNEAKRLYLKNNYLESEDKLYKIELEQDKIKYLLKNNEIIPNLFLIFSYLVFWCGIKPLVGYGSGNYLTKMKEVWMEIFQESDKEEYLRTKGINTKSLVGGQIVTYNRNEKNEIYSQFAFDVIYNGGLDKKYLKNLFSMQYRALLKPALMEIYESYVPLDERIDLQLKTSDMMGKEFNWI